MEGAADKYRWPRDGFRSAVWESELRPLERLIALAYAEHAADRDYAWVTYPRLQDCTGLSRDAIARAIDGLRSAGWLELKEATRQQRSPRYWLRIPTAQQSVSRTAESVLPPGRQGAGYPHPSVSQTAEALSPLSAGLQGEVSSPSPDTSPLPPDTSSPRGRADQSSHPSTDQSTRASVLPADQQRAVFELAARGIDESAAAQCVAVVAATKHPDDLSRYVSRFTVEDVDRWAGRREARRLTKPKRRRCDHGVLIASDGTCCEACAAGTGEATA
ncbi:helix-turn-helix domain-containing protein [Nocardioides sp.]|uniref:helix-turn-helix domain-containing protein n=1 Tax=Nocardioides sp. TaxID=35761 RepID=UPI003783396C